MRGMWVLSPGETPGAWRLGVSPGRDWMCAEDGCSVGENNDCVLDYYCTLA